MFEMACCWIIYRVSYKSSDSTHPTEVEQTTKQQNSLHRFLQEAKDFPQESKVKKTRKIQIYPSQSRPCTDIKGKQYALFSRDSMLDSACVKGEWLQDKTILLPCNQRPKSIIQRYQKKEGIRSKIHHSRTSQIQAPIVWARVVRPSFNIPYNFSSRRSFWQKEWCIVICFRYPHFPLCPA